MVRIFIGTDADLHSDAEKVVEWSIRKYTSSDVQINFIRPGWKSGCTGFTNHRFLVPELCGHEGYAIYLDVDMLVLGDIEELWNYKTPGKWCTTPMRDDVSVIDCSAFPWMTEATAKVLHKNQIRAKIPDHENIPEVWNHCDKWQPDTKLIHYTDLDTQPWVFNNHPNKLISDLFFEYLEEANDNLY